MKILAISGWCLALVFVVLAMRAYRDQTALTQQVEMLEDKNLNLQARLDTLAALERTETSPQEQPPAPIPSASPPLTPEDVEEPAPEVTIPAPPVQEEDPAQDDLPHLSEQQQQMLQVQTSAFANMTYGEFLAQFNLPPETADAVNNAIQEALGQEMLLQQQALRRDPPWSGVEIGARKEAIREQLRQALAAHFTPDQLEAWDLQQAVASQVFYEQLVGGQLAMLAPGLGEEARLTVQGVLGEELAYHLDSMNLSENPYSMDQFIEAQRTALESSAQRLAGVLDEAESAELTRYITLAEQTFAAMAQQ